MRQPVNASITWLVRNNPAFADRSFELEASYRWLINR